jgi:predicted permease
MSPVAASLVPVFLLIVTGWGARVSGIVNESQWAGFEKVTYLVLFQALVVETLARADLANAPLAAVGGALMGAILLMAGLLLLVRPALARWLGMDGPSFTSVFQGALRWNTFVAIALCGSLFGKAGTTLCAVAIAAMIPLLNVSCVLVLSRHAGGAPLGAKALAGTLIRNPFIWSSLLGIGINASGVPVPSVVLSYAEILGRASLAAGLLVVGAGLDLARLRQPSPALALATLVKLAGMPLLAASLARLFGVEGTALAVVVLCTAAPTASGSYMLARQMGGNAPLMAEILTVQTLAALLTIPLALAWLS